MGVIPTRLITSGLALFVLLAGTSLSVMALASTRSGGRLIDPFMPYAYVLLAEPPDDFVQRRFECQREYIGRFGWNCALKPASGIFSEIRVNIGDCGEHCRQVIYRLRPNSLSVGDLVMLWGKPEIRTDTNYMAFNWPNIHSRAVAMIIDYQPFSFFLPISSVTITLLPMS